MFDIYRRIQIGKEIKDEKFMKKVVILLIMALVSLAGSAQKVDLVKLGSTLRSMNLSMGYSVRNDMFVVKDNVTELYGIMNLKGEMIQQPRYRFVEFLEHGGLMFVQTTDSTFGLMNSQWQWVVEDVSTEDDYFEYDYYWGSNGFFPIPRNGKWGLMDSLGIWLMPTEYESILVVDDERRWVETEEGLYDVNKKKLLLKGVENVSKVGYNLYRAQKDRKYGLIDTLGRWVVEPKYDWINNESEGFMSFRRNVHTVAQDTVSGVGYNGYRNTTYYYRNYGYMDTMGREVIPAQFDGASCFENGYAEVKISGKWGYIDKTGKVVVPCKYDEGSAFQKNGNAWVMTESGGKKIYHLIDGQGKILSTVEDKEVVFFEKNTVVWFIDGGKWLVTDYEGKALATYDDVEFDEGNYYSDEDMIAVRQGRKWGLADKDYRIVIPCRYRSVERYGQGPGAIVTLDDGSTRYIDRRGRTIFKLDGLESVKKVREDLYMVLIRSMDGEHYNKWGLVDGKGRSTFSKEELESARKAYIEDLELYERREYSEEVVENVVGEVKAEPESAKESSDDDEVFVLVEDSPEFPGGMDSLYAFLGANIHYPAEAKKDSIEGLVFVQFVVEKDGSIYNIRVLRDIGGGCGEEVVRVMNMMPKWQPAKQRGTPVRCQFNLPVKFSLEEEKK